MNAYCHRCGAWSWVRPFLAWCARCVESWEQEQAAKEEVRA